MFFETVLYYVLLQILSRKSREEEYNRAENITSAVPSTITSAIAKENTALIYLRELTSHPVLKDKKKGRRKKKRSSRKELNTAVQSVF